MKHQESSMQMQCVKWFRYQYANIAPLLFAVPNGGQRNAITAKILKAEGVVPGVADLILMVPNADYHALCIEMKAGKTGRQSEYQKQWQNAVVAAGYKYVVCRSFDDFHDTVTNYLATEKGGVELCRNAEAKKVAKAKVAANK